MSNTQVEVKQNSNYILVGFFGILLVLALSGIVIAISNAREDTHFFVDFVGTFLMCATPTQVMIAIVWQNNPSFLSRISQPLKGLATTLLTALAGAIVMAVSYHTIGQQSITPILIHFIIQSVVVSLVILLVFKGWPFTKLSSNPILNGIGLIVYCYIINFILFSVFYNYSFLAEMPFYSEDIDPKGLFNGLTAITFSITLGSMLMITLMFDLWPMSKFAGRFSEALFSLLVTIYLLIITSLVYYFFVNTLGMDPMDFIVKGPVCIIFGTFLVKHMMQFQLFAQLVQPKKGIYSTVVCFIFAFLMYQLYSTLLPLFVGNPLNSGPTNGYAQELWLATAMLGVTFPIINMVSGAFDFWPIKRPNKAE